MFNLWVMTSLLSALSAHAQAPAPEASVSPSPVAPTSNTSVEVGTWVQKISGEKLAKLFSVEVEHQRTGQKVSTFVFAFEGETPIHEKETLYFGGEPCETESECDVVRTRYLQHFEIEAAYKRQLGAKGAGDEPSRQIVVGPIEIKKDGEVYSLTAYALGIELNREFKLGSDRLELVTSVGLNSLGFRHLTSETGQKFDGVQLAGLYPTAAIEYEVSKKVTAVFEVESIAKLARSFNGQELREGKIKLTGALETHLDGRFLRHLDSVWVRREQKFNWASVNEVNYQVGMTFRFGIKRDDSDGLTPEERDKAMYSPEERVRFLRKTKR